MYVLFSLLAHLTLKLYYRKYLSDPTEDVRVATENLLSEFLREIRDVTLVSRQITQQQQHKTPAESIRQVTLDSLKEKLPELNMENAERALYMLENDEHDRSTLSSHLGGRDDASEMDDHDIGCKSEATVWLIFVLISSSAWIPGQGVRIDYPAIIEILIRQLDGESKLLGAFSCSTINSPFR